MAENNSNSSVDDESQAMLDDLKAQEKTPEKKSAPKKKASKKKAEDVKDPEPKADVAESADNGDSESVTNIGKNPRRIAGTVIKPGESYTLTEYDLEDDVLLAKIDRGVELGVLRHGAD